MSRNRSLNAGRRGIVDATGPSIGSVSTKSVISFRDDGNRARSGSISVCRSCIAAGGVEFCVGLGVAGECIDSITSVTIEGDVATRPWFLARDGCGGTKPIARDVAVFYWAMRSVRDPLHVGFVRDRGNAATGLNGGSVRPVSLRRASFESGCRMDRRRRC